MLLNLAWAGHIVLVNNTNLLYFMWITHTILTYCGLLSRKLLSVVVKS